MSNASIIIGPIARLTQLIVIITISFFLLLTSVDADDELFVAKLTVVELENRAIIHMDLEKPKEQTSTKSFSGNSVEPIASVLIVIEKDGTRHFEKISNSCTNSAIHAIGDLVLIVDTTNKTIYEIDTRVHEGSILNRLFSKAGEDGLRESFHHFLMKLGDHGISRRLDVRYGFSQIDDGINLMCCSTRIEFTIKDFGVKKLDFISNDNSKRVSISASEFLKDAKSTNH
ncbi:MAG: hypothetical protein ACK5YR_01535 [Pirellula sp.]|jgi:hypothetical protein